MTSPSVDVACEIRILKRYRAPNLPERETMLHLKGAILLLCAGALAAPESVQSVDNAAVKAEILSQEELFLKLAGDLPKEMVFQRELLISRL